MSPILDIQRKLHERGRIRMGEKRPDEKFPRKLETFRLTSSDEAAIRAAAEQWGGECEPWDSPNGRQWQVTTEASALDVIVPPGDMAFSQWRELWTKAGCIRRCDGQRETLSDEACVCPADPAERNEAATRGEACRDTTRLSVMLPDLPGFGLWRLESHGYYAATELQGTISLIAQLAPGSMIRGRLLAEQRSAVRTVKGKPQTQRWVVPVLDLPDVRLSEMLEPAGVGVAIAAPSSGLTPIDAPARNGGASVREQLAALPSGGGEPRSNAAAPIRSTGVEPPGWEPETDEGGDPPDWWDGFNKACQAKVADVWPDELTDARQKRRKALIGLITDGRTDSSKDLDDPSDRRAVLDALDAIGAGRLELAARASGGYELRPVGGGSGDAALPETGVAWKEWAVAHDLPQSEPVKVAARLSGRSVTHADLAKDAELGERVRAELEGART